MEKNSHKLAYILPNLFTAASIFLGVLSILASIKGDYDKAMILIIVSLICDGLDGRVARLTNTASKFGVEFDSLADIIAFGVAPAVLFYFNLGQEYGRLGSLAMAVFIIFGAIRLARFNVTTGTYDPRVFIGLPIPTAAVVLGIWVVFYKHHFDNNSFIEIFIIFLTFLLSFLMVSNVRYPSFKKIEFQKANILKALVILIFICSLIYLRPLEIFTLIMSAYVIYGLSRAIYNLYIKKIKKVG
ncbi:MULTISPECIES: CDP-diacylglycerol--serine O-phosphatidyltransferase [unclassified Campylobacter]|uniref:CDP-diacylglycerol--serine O-phosphatidyltransferase n=1 Tax=unclassified Campylobacter TaxID=2593542 RepID=UPI001BDA4245|nr:MULTISPECIES: CDP-diacylglycerol--serine O-phosphatidyltransferase [unclassified Campylobacter]MBZ7975411.1 CDP-diacylglycerol--serine O-phosphatidyltransferase [Campylobacter sp. RM12637]MBZ7979140.1 CDP-diacylglycerol--serine O-phosphatidyltransferase [Campylobacter sp. RM12642]MBZ7981756.1 CDP-diacylglycerol--serine O-phosphatidyltransferase [Campylobacter sp. RM12640]MBZ7983150.1 CDP-diacylglycerol--serine O-phosphatidyltransferase [Campylobacter sp. RM12647]MBZ7988634.1 CDP-diacylglyce